MSSIEKMMERLAQKNQDKKNIADDAQSVDSVIEVDSSQKVDKKSVAEPVLDNRRAPFEVQLNRLVEAGYLPGDLEKSCQFNEYRRIKRPILRKAFPTQSDVRGLPRNIVMISSAIPGEGKTFCSINLTLNMILERDITVVLMDVDCIRRSLSKVFGVENSPGLVDVLVGDRKIEDIVINTSIPQLKIVPAGRFHQHTAELLAGEGMKTLMDEMANRYTDRIILMDAPPLLAANDAEILSHYAGQAVIVIQAESTSLSLIQKALACIDTVKTDTGLILNKCRGVLVADNGGYDYYSDYASGSDEAEKV